MSHKSAAATMRATSLRITGSLVIMVMLLWTIHCGFRLAAEARRYTYVSWAFHIGVATTLVGFAFLILGLPILADLFLNLSDHLQKETSIRQAATEARTTCKLSAHILVTMFGLSMLLWAIYTGFRLTTKSGRDSKYHNLTVTVGIITIVFGLIYFIIGLAIFVELAMELSSHLMQRDNKDTRTHQGYNAAIRCFDRHCYYV